MAREKYPEWGRLFHLKEMVPVDLSLNGELVEPDRNREEDRNSFVQHGIYAKAFILL